MESSTPLMGEKKRESLGSRLGFILLSAGCAIGLGNVWRFPYIVGQYGGAAFILLYLIFLVIFGLPIMTMEFSVGRASRRSVATSFRVLEPKGTKWHIFGWFGMAGNYLLMMFYTTVTGWMLAYFIKMLKGEFVGLTPDEVGTSFAALKGDPWAVVLFMALAVLLGFLICSLGLQRGVEKITKVMMLALLAIIVALAIRSVTLPGAGEGLKYYLIPNFHNMIFDAEGKVIFGEVIFAAIGQAFFTLSIGIGSMAIFGSYIPRERRLFGEALSVATLDTAVAFIAGLIIIPACFAFGVDQAAGPDLVFITLPNVFNSMGPVWGRIFGSLFFLFMCFAALSTVIAVFENLVSFPIDLFGWSRSKSCLVNCAAVLVLSLPCALGFNLLSGIQPFGDGTNIMDLEDFIVSNNLLPLGSLVYLLFCTAPNGMGFDGFLKEANTGKGLGFSPKLRPYVTYVLPILLIIFWAIGNITFFLK